MGWPPTRCMIKECLLCRLPATVPKGRNEKVLEMYCFENSHCAWRMGVCVEVPSVRDLAPSPRVVRYTLSVLYHISCWQAHATFHSIPCVPALAVPCVACPETQSWPTIAISAGIQACPTNVLFTPTCQQPHRALLSCDAKPFVLVLFNLLQLLCLYQLDAHHCAHKHTSFGRETCALTGPVHADDIHCNGDPCLVLRRWR